jgi:hypothetical protein
MDLVLDPGSLPHQVSAAGDLPTQRPGPIVRQPHRRQEVRRQQLRENPRVYLVGLDLRLRDARVFDGFDTTTTRPTIGVSKSRPSRPEMPLPGLGDTVPQPLPRASCDTWAFK